MQQLPFIMLERHHINNITSIGRKKGCCSRQLQYVYLQLCGFCIASNASLCTAKLNQDKIKDNEKWKFHRKEHMNKSINDREESVHTLYA